MSVKSEKTGVFSKVWQYLRNLPDPSPYWRVQSTAWGIALAALIGCGLVFALTGLRAVAGGGNVSYEGVGSPGPVVFRHLAHMSFMDGKYKECKSCHDRIFASQKYGTFSLAALRDSPERKVRIGKDASTLCLPGTASADDGSLVTYDVSRACATCATGNCHDGKESFSRFDCLGCHKPY
jgi:hypothetical protein